MLSDIAFGMHEIPHDGPYNTGMRNMEYALTLLAGVYAGNRDEPNLNGCLTYFNLTLFYQSIVEIRGGQMLNGNGIDIVQRKKFVIKHVHCNLFADYILPMEYQYIFRRILAVAMSGRPRLNLRARSAPMHSVMNVPSGMGVSLRD